MCIKYSYCLLFIMYKKLVFVFISTSLTLLSNNTEDEVYKLSDFIVTDSGDKGYYSTTAHLLLNQMNL